MSLLSGPRHLAPDQVTELASSLTGSRGIKRSIELVRLFRAEQSEPDRYYATLAEDTARQIEDYVPLTGQLVLDIGGGPGHFSAAFTSRGARCAIVEPDARELLSRGTAPSGALIGDGCALPVRDGSADLCFSSNVLEHVPDPAALIGEMVRAARPGGLIYLSFTNWYSPWSGHEMSPWHYLGPGYAERRYASKHGRLPKNRYGAGLYPVHVGAVLKLLRARPDIDLVDALPRYYPKWCRPVVRVPGVREVATWNLLTIARKVP